MNLQKYCDNRAISGYGSALLYLDPAVDNDGLYHLLIPLETVPSVNGSADTFEYDLLTCPTKGQVEGKESLEQAEIEFLWHRDNVKRLEALQGKTIDFLAVYGDFTGRKFSGTVKVRANEAGADVMKGTFTITPTSASTTTLLDCRSLIKETVTIASNVEANVVISGTGNKEIEFKCDPTEATIKAVSDTPSVATVSATGSKVTITGVTKGYAIVTISAEATGYAGWETSVMVEVTE
jgi:hypothetical protein